MDRRKFMEASAALSVGVLRGSAIPEKGTPAALPSPSSLPFPRPKEQAENHRRQDGPPQPKKPLPHYEPAPGSWSTGGAEVANPMSIYPKYKARRDLFMADDLGPDAVEIATDKGIKGNRFWRAGVQLCD